MTSSKRESLDLTIQQQQQSKFVMSNTNTMVGDTPVIQELGAIVPTSAMFHYPQKCDLQQNDHNQYEMSRTPIIGGNGQEMHPAVSASVPVKMELLNDSTNLSSSSVQMLDCSEIPRGGSTTPLNRRSSVMSLPGQSELFAVTHDSPKNMAPNCFTLQPTKTQGGEFYSPNMQPHPTSSLFMFGTGDMHQPVPQQPDGHFIGADEDKPVHECDACGKRLCSIRSLKRHRNTCKRVKAQQDSQDEQPSPATKITTTTAQTSVIKAEKSQQSKKPQQFTLNGQKQTQTTPAATSLQSNVVYKSDLPGQQVLNGSVYLIQQQKPPALTSPIKLTFVDKKIPQDSLEPLQPSNSADIYHGQFNHIVQTSTASIPTTTIQSQMHSFHDKILDVNGDTEPSKVSDVVDSVVAKLRLQSGSNRTDTAQQVQHLNGSNQIQQQQQHMMQQQNIQTNFNMPAEWATPASFPQHSGFPQIVNSQNNHYSNLTKQQQPQTNYSVVYRQQQQTEQQQSYKNTILSKSESLKESIIHREIGGATHPLALPGGPRLEQHQQQQKGEPPKSAPVPTTAPIQQFWQVMGARVVPPPMPTTISSAAEPTPTSMRYRNGMNDANKLICSPPPYPGNAPAQIVAKRQSSSNCAEQQQFNQAMGSPNALTTTTPSTIVANTSTSVESSSKTADTIQQQSSSGGKNVYRYLCPECDKPYSCRKNVKRHRISQHKVPTQEAQDGLIKRIRLTEAEIQLQQQQQTKAKSEASEKKQEIQTLGQQNATTKSQLKGPEEKPNISTQVNTSEPASTNKKSFELLTQRSGIQQEQQPAHIFSNNHFDPTAAPRSAPILNQTQQQQFFTYQNTPYGVSNNAGEQQPQPYVYPIPPMEQYQYEQQQQVAQQQQQFYAQSQQQFQPTPPSVQYQRYQTSQPPIQLPPQQQPVQQPQQPQEKRTPAFDVQPQQHLHYETMPGPSYVTGPNAFQQPPQQYHQQQTHMETEVGYANNNTGVYGPPPQHFNGPGFRPMPNGLGYMQHHSQSYNNISYQQQQHMFSEHPQQQHPATAAFGSGGPSYVETLDCWDQIKSGVDAMPTNDSDAIEMARIVEDLKKTEQVAERRKYVRAIQQQQQQQLHQQQQQAHGQLFTAPYQAMPIAHQQQSNIVQGEDAQQPGQRKAVELAEADTTFSPPSLSDDSAAANVARHGGVKTQQHYAQMISHNQLVPESPNYSMLRTQHVGARTQIFQFENNNAASVIGAAGPGMQTIMKKSNVMAGDVGHNTAGGFVEFGQQKFMTIWGNQGGFVPTTQPYDQQHASNGTVAANDNSNNNINHAEPKTSAVSTKKPQSSSGKTPANNGGNNNNCPANFVCPACQKGYSTDYSLKRHRQVCPVLTGGKDGSGAGTRKRKNNSSTNATSNSKGKRVDEHRQIDPDSTMNESPPTDEAASRRPSDAAFIVHQHNNSMDGVDNTGIGNKNALIYQQQQFFSPSSATNAQS